VKNFLLQKRQFLLYCVIGFSGVGLDFAIFSLLIKTNAADLRVANAIGYASGTLLSFVLNAKFNFRTTDRILLRMLSFFGVAALGLFVSDCVLRLLVNHWHQDKYLAKMATLVVVVALQYNLNRLLSFRKAST